MSKYTNYEQVSKTYDSVRYASGVDTMTFILAGMLKKKAEEICMLEAGCGTGNYSVGFLQNGIGKLTMMDASTGMLQRAREKVESYGRRVTEINQHELPTIPYPNESFDVVTLIQVCHHLDTYHLNLDDSAASYKEKYPNLQSTIKEAYRVLKPQGVLLIDHSFGVNIDSSWLSLAPKALSLWKAAFIPEGDLIDLLTEENYGNVFYITRPGGTLSKNGILNNPELILDEKWRNCCSEWSFIDRTGELPGIIELIQKKKEEGKLREFAHERNRLFRLVGETTTVFAQKV